MSHRSYGSKCQPGVYRDTAEIAKDIRAEVKALRKLGAAGGGFDVPAEAKISVRTSKYSGGSSIRVAISAPAEWVYVRPGAPEGPEYYHQPAHGGETLAAKLAVKVIKHVVAQHNYDGSDSQTDYFDVNFYDHVTVDVLDAPHGYLPVDRSGAVEPVAIGEALGRFDSAVQDAWEAMPYGAAVEAQRAQARAEQEAADAERYAAEQAAAQAAQDAEVDAFATELDDLAVNPAEVIGIERDVAVAEVIDAVADVAADAVAGRVIMAGKPDEMRVAHDERHMVATWVLDRHPAPDADSVGAPRECAELLVMYSKGRGWHGSINRVTRGASNGGPFTCSSSSPMDAVRLSWSQPAKRYSRKDAPGAVAAAIAHVQADPERYLPKFLISDPTGTFRR